MFMYNYSLYLLFYLSTLNIISINNWMMIWMMMELNMLMLIPLINNNNFFDSTIKYFIMQLISSMMLSFSLMTNFSFISISLLNNNLFSLTLMMKLTLFPFYMWIINISEFMNWFVLFNILTIQKIPFMYIMSSFMNKFIMLIFILTLTTNMMNIINYNSVMKIITSSSINNSIMMLILATINISYWACFILNYMTILMMIMSITYKNKINYISQMNKLNIKTKFYLIMNFLSMMGIPPLMLFLPKWMLLSSLLKINLNLPLIFIMLFYLLSIFIYLKSVMFILMKFKMNIKWVMNKPSNLYLNLNMMNFMVMFF